MTGDPDTMTAVKRAVDDRDVPILVDLLGDPDDRIAGVATSVVAAFRAKAVPLLREATKSSAGYKHVRATMALATIEGALRRDSPTPER